MKPPLFEYHDPTDVDRALELLAEHGDDAKPLAGGQSLVPLLNFRLAHPDHIVDLGRISELAYVRRTDGVLRIGTMTRQSTLEASPLVAANWPLLTGALAFVAHQQIRNRGTVGGSVAHADPAAELPVALAALDASLLVRSRTTERRLGWREFFVTHLTTALEPDELLLEVEVPPVPSGTGWAFTEYARRHGDFALGGAAALLTFEDGVCRRARLVLLAAAATPLRPEAAERMLEGNPVTDELAAEAARAAVADINPTGDIHGGTEYRKQLIEGMVRRAVGQATERAGR
ncbi:MAG: FAD binding domain-containing protein [Actinomycetota bacterium]|nr:FAD binding domain-containing protein [Actinomycetota bacterium]